MNIAHYIIRMTADGHCMEWMYFGTLAAAQAAYDSTPAPENGWVRLSTGRVSSFAVGLRHRGRERVIAAK